MRSSMAESIANTFHEARSVDPYSKAPNGMLVNYTHETLWDGFPIQKVMCNSSNSFAWFTNFALAVN